MISTSALRVQFIKSLERDFKRLTAELESVTGQLAALNGSPKKVAFADTPHHEVKKARHLSAAGRAAISRAAKKRWREQKAKAKANGK